MEYIFFYITGGVGLVAILVGSLMGWGDGGPGKGMCVGAFIALAGFVATVLVGEIPGWTTWHELVEQAGLQGMGGGWVIFGGCFIWSQLVRRRVRAQRMMEDEVRRSLAARQGAEEETGTEQPHG